MFKIKKLFFKSSKPKYVGKCEGEGKGRYLTYFFPEEVQEEGSQGPGTGIKVNRSSR